MIALSDEQFASITNCQKVDDGRHAHARREAGRVGWSSRVTLYRMEDGRMIGPAIDGRIRDISKTGVGVISHVAMQLQASFAVLLPQMEESGPIILSCLVRRSESAGERLFSIGGQFTERMTPAEIPAKISVVIPAKISAVPQKRCAALVESMSAMSAQETSDVDRIRSAVLCEPERRVLQVADLLADEPAPAAAVEDPRLAAIRSAILSDG